MTRLISMLAAPTSVAHSSAAVIHQRVKTPHGPPPVDSGRIRQARAHCSLPAGTHHHILPAVGATPHGGVAVVAGCFVAHGSAVPVEWCLAVAGCRPVALATQAGFRQASTDCDRGQDGRRAGVGVAWRVVGDIGNTRVNKIRTQSGFAEHLLCGQQMNQGASTAAGGTCCCPQQYQW